MMRAVLLMVVGMSLIPLGDSAAKLLSAGHGAAPVFIAWSRFLVGAILLMPFLSARHFRRDVWTDPRVLFRSTLIVCAILSILTALRTEAVADVFGAFFVGPIISVALSAIFLGERVSPARVTLLILGFCGVLLVVRPGFGMTPGLGFAVLAGTFYGSYLTASRWLAGVAPPRSLLLAQLTTGAIVLAPLGLAALPAPTLPVLGLTVLSAGASMAGNLLLILAYNIAPAARLAPFVYVQLIAATFYGWSIFGTLPDALTWAGLALLVATGLASLGLRR